MKLRIDGRGIADWLVRRGERLGAVVVGLLALFLVWRGFDALRSLSATEAQVPEAIERVATQARGHIDRDPQPPAELLSQRRPLADEIDPWRTALVPWNQGATPGLVIAPPPQAVAVLDNPLFEELARRSRPDVLAVEDLRAVAGLAILPPPAAGAGGPGREPAVPGAPGALPPGPPPRPAPGAGRKPPRGGDPLAVRPDPAALPPERPLPEAPVARGRVVPYVIVTGLLPVVRQKQKYLDVFASTSYREPDRAERDTPRWCDFEIERGVVGKDGAVNWTKIDLSTVVKSLAAAGGNQPVSVPAEFLLNAEEDARHKKTTPLGFCAPLPPRIDGTWELGDLHPWVAERLAEKLAEQDASDPAQGPRDIVDAGPGREGPGFGRIQEQPVEPVAPDQPRLPDFRLFRFVDTDVKPGQTYRYRVRLKVWNPNYHEKPEVMRPHLTDPALAVDQKLTSPDAETAVAATVPDTTRVLVGTLRRDEIKDLRLRPGMLEVLVMAPDEQAGSFSLRALVAEPGAPADIDEKYNLKNQRDRARGARLTTGILLVDARGRQENRLDAVPDKSKPDVIPEPLDVLCLRPDGSFEIASLAESEQSIEDYGATLPSRDAKADLREPGLDVPRGELPSDPLTRPGRGR